MAETLEIDRRTQRRHDTGLASTYQLDCVRRDHGFRAIVVAAPDGEMLLGSMDEPIGKPLARATAGVGLRSEPSDELLLRHLATEDLHVVPTTLDGYPVYLGILGREGQDIPAAFERTITGLHRIFATT